MGNFAKILFMEETDDGTTVDDYTSIAFDIRTKKAITIRLKNTGSTNGLTYKVLSYANFDGVISKEEVAATNLAADADAEVTLPTSTDAANRKLAKVILQVKSQVAGSPTDYTYETIAGRH